jgi:hypothetical protein
MGAGALHAVKESGSVLNLEQIQAIPDVQAFENGPTMPKGLAAKFETWSSKNALPADGVPIMTKTQVKDCIDYAKVLQPEIFVRCQLEEQMRSTAESRPSAAVDGAPGDSDGAPAAAAPVPLTEQMLHACGKHKAGGGAADLPTLQAMLSMGADVNAQDESGWAGLHHAR